MDLFKALTGKNPAEFKNAARVLVDSPDIDLFKKLVKQDGFLFDFVKNNVSTRIKEACTKENYKNLLKFFEYYSPSYDGMFAEVLYGFGGENIIPEIENLYKNGSDSQKAYAVKFFSLLDNEKLQKYIPQIRKDAVSDFEELSTNAIEVLSKVDDEISKQEAVEKLNSEDEFEQYNAIKFLVTFGAKDCLPKIFHIMKNSSLSENIAAEIPFLVPLETLLAQNPDGAILVLCNIINAIPEIVSPSVVIDYNLFEILENLYYENLTSSSALLLRLAQTKFESITENEEYLFDCDKNTKDEIFELNKFLSSINKNKLNSLLYDELYEDSDFVFFAVDYADNIEELETLLDSKNQTLILKALTALKEKGKMSDKHKEIALSGVSNPHIKQIIEML